MLTISYYLIALSFYLKEEICRRMKVLKLKGLIFCYVLIIYDRCYCMNSSALNISKSRNEMFGSRMLKKMWLSTKQSCYSNNTPTITEFSTLPQTFKKYSILKHKNSITVRDKRTESIPSLTYYHSKFRMNLLRKQRKKESTTNNKRRRRQRRKFLQMVQSLPTEHRYKFGIPPKDCRYHMCNITGKLVLKDTLMFVAMTVCFKMI